MFEIVFFMKITIS